MKNNNFNKKILLNIQGKIIHGCKIGTKIGFPTANIKICKKIPISNGVYIVTVKKILNKKNYAIANIGIKPTFLKKKKILELHIFNINCNLYNKKIKLIIHKKIRNEIKFYSIYELKKQINQDIIKVSNYFNIKYLNKKF
ncbi:riboflavin kinase [Buchnera aphidicola (Mollitrichosiphum nigrofasciatum)]|uniref:riboflavin kinase n=1 Tax=Buchnera aphidicola TaxID=9 RepID=UPI0031B8808C